MFKRPDLNVLPMQSKLCVLDSWIELFIGRCELETHFIKKDANVQAFVNNLVKFLENNPGTYFQAHISDARKFATFDL